VSALAAIGLAGLTTAPVGAVHDLGLFELDRNPQDDAVAGDDWETLITGNGGSVAKTDIPIVDADSPTDTTYFSGGGSKDVNDVTQWLHSATDVAPDKDEILNAFAAAYRAADGDLIIYFGLDRFANNGDAQVGFWFFQNEISLNPDGTFSGVHTVGDVLVLAHFSGGGRIDSIEAFEWVGPPDPDNLAPLFGGQGVDCVGALAGDNLCGTVNRVNTPTEWAYTPKSGTTGIYPQGSFFEGGINITEAVGGACFSSFLAETRSSTSLTAQLKDFALGAFNLCVPSTLLTKTASADTIHVGESVTYTYTETNDGTDPLENVTITDDGCSPVIFQSGDADSDGVLDPGETWTFTCGPVTFDSPGTFTNTATASGFDPFLGKIVTACPPGDPSVDFCDPDEQAQATVEVIRPGTILTKTAVAEVTYSYTEGNDGTVPLHDVQVTDDHCSPVTPVLSAGFNVGDTNQNGLLDVGENWQFTCTTTITGPASVTNTAIGSAVDTLGTEVTFCTEPDPRFCDPDERDSVTVLIQHN
jgi:uncharacterized repeat protein (TIGR01451 family)